MTAKDLVVGVDGTAAGVAALRWAADQARGTGARVSAIAVTERPLPVAGGPEIGGGFVAQPVIDDEQLAAAADAWLTEAIAALPADARQVVDRQARHGDAATLLLEAARDADLLVLGNHGRGGLAGALTGSVAQRCAHHVTCPLVLVPGPQEDVPG
ncbi:universal stress protein [Pseudonocardia sp. DSM 110487]|uniref:universal stress protein n=1 Tax=Pseudonocardia sp. DSM 110487 TaxID=2865833 RepID=UPI001C6A338A|nr:universal stress protein [Pseudonocardia sp. DSM 110487]QYN38473.1 universal stress protein [Pseudonocardia sp. DSM 110487]